MQVNSPRGLVIAAVNFDDQTDAVVQTAVYMAKRYGMEIRFVSVVEAVLYTLATYGMPYAYYGNPAVDVMGQEALEKERQAQLAALLAKLPADVNATAAVLVGNVEASIIAEATTRRANFVLVACNPNAFSRVGSGFSTAIQLMHDAPLPVLVVSNEAALAPTKPDLRILLTDDLREGTGEAAHKAYELALLSPGAHLRHLHVSPHALDGKERQACVDLERQRGHPMIGKLEKAGMRIEWDVCEGKLTEAIEAATSDFQPDVVVFGRHRLLRARPFLIGRMPFSAMLRARRAVLLVPPAAELFARLPFPATVN